MEGARRREVTKTDVEQYNDDKSSEDKSYSDLTSVTQPTETASGHSGDLSSEIKGSESGLEDKEKKEGELLECETATNRKKKRKRKKKKPDPVSPEVENSIDQVCFVEEVDQNGGSSVSKSNAEEGCKKNDDELEPSTPRKKKKKKKKKKKMQVVTDSELPTGDDGHVTGADVKSNNVDLQEAGMSSGKVETGQHGCQMRSNLEEVAHETDVTFEDQGNFDKMENKMLGVEDDKSSIEEGGDSVVLGFADGSHKAFECTPDCGSTLLTAGEDFPASDEKARCSSPEVVTESMGPEATVKGGAEETEGDAKCTDLMGELELSDVEDSYVM